MGVIALAALVPAHASGAEGEEGFFSYLPAPSDLKLPEISIPDFWTGDLKKAKKAYRAGDYVRARKYFQKASEDGNIVADWYLGHMSRLGRGGPKDDAAAFSYYSRVADAFSDDETDNKRLRITVDALVQVADYYRRGSSAAGVKQDFPRAMRIYNLAATFGHPAAQYALGIMHLKGQGVQSSPPQGLKWLFKSAMGRYAPAEAQLGELYWKGQFVKPDRTRALMWYILAKETAKPEEHPEIHDRLDELMGQASDEERLEAEARATVWSDDHPASAVVQNAAQ